MKDNQPAVKHTSPYRRQMGADYEKLHPEIQKRFDFSITGQSGCNAATHSCLIINIKNDSVSAWIDLNSVRESGKKVFPLESGFIKMDRYLLQHGVVKAEFDFRFSNTLDPENEMYWKGLIYSKIGG